MPEKKRREKKTRTGEKCEKNGIDATPREIRSDLFVGGVGRQSFQKNADGAKLGGERVHQWCEKQSAWLS